MAMTASSRPRWMIFPVIVAVLFGILTIYSGASVLFIDGPARVAAGAYVPFVLWFNFFAGFAYILAGAGLYLWRKWAVNLSICIAIATLLVFAAFGFHAMTGGAYEARTLVAMILRSAVWLTIAYFAWSRWTDGYEGK